MKQHILIVDDDRDELVIYLEALQRLPLNIKCTYAESAEHALQMLDHLVPDFIFLDVNMPKVDGLECLKRIREQEKLSKVQVIMFSNGMNDTLQEKVIKLGADGCHQKACDIRTLSEKLIEILQLSTAH
ncbi:MAG TPA: response regulator [Ferruginibacter sp.]|nr:response regulator [Ferruginibacter sp.]